jgi:hypothetical protein
MLQKRKDTLSGCRTQRYTPLTGFAQEVALDSKGHFLNQKASGCRMLLHATGAVLPFSRPPFTGRVPFPGPRCAAKGFSP